MQQKIEIVVARFNESLNWTNEYPFNLFKYTVYNKGPNEKFVKTRVAKIINLPNMGRCDHTYLHHIVENFDSGLAPVVVFLPGSVNDPSKKPKAIFILKYILANRKGVMCVQNVHRSVYHTFNTFTLDHWTCSNAENRFVNSESVLTMAKIRPFGAWYRYFFGNIVVPYACLQGVFAVDRRDIKKMGKQKYIQLCNATMASSNPEVGHYVERAWTSIFYPLLYTQVHKLVKIGSVVIPKIYNS